MLVEQTDTYNLLYFTTNGLLIPRRAIVSGKTARCSHLEEQAHLFSLGKIRATGSPHVSINRSNTAEERLFDCRIVERLREVCQTQTVCALQDIYKHSRLAKVQELATASRCSKHNIATLSQCSEAPVGDRSKVYIARHLCGDCNFEIQMQRTLD